MEVRYLLSCIGALVGNEAVAALGKTSGVCNLDRRGKAASRKGARIPIGVGKRADMLPWDDEQMDGRYGMDIRKGDHLAVLIDLRGGHVASGDLAENAVGLRHGARRRRRRRGR